MIPVAIKIVSLEPWSSMPRECQIWAFSRLEVFFQDELISSVSKIPKWDEKKFPDLNRGISFVLSSKLRDKTFSNAHVYPWAHARSQTTLPADSERTTSETEEYRSPSEDTYTYLTHENIENTKKEAIYSGLLPSW